MAVGDKFLIVKTGRDVSSVAEGELTPLPSGVQDQLVGRKEMRTLRSRFYPFYNESFRLAGYIVIGFESHPVRFSGPSFPDYYVSSELFTDQWGARPTTRRRPRGKGRILRRGASRDTDCQ